jgi:hypothetical protein
VQNTNSLKPKTMVLIHLYSLAFFCVYGAKAFDMVCNNDNTLTVNIPYDKPAQILSVDYGDCTKDDIAELGIQDPDTLAFKVILDVTRCGMDGKLRNLQYDQKAKIVVGRQIGDIQLIFSDFNVDAFCEYETEYVIKFSYGVLELETALYDQTGGTIKLEFEIASYDATFENKVDAPSTGGDMIHLGLIVTSEGFSHERKKFAPTKCAISDVNEPTTTYTLFDTAETCSNSLIDLAISYENNMWRISHILFLLDSRTTSQYELSCHVTVCDAEKADACQAVLDACA